MPRCANLMIFSATNLVAGSSFPGRKPISSQARSNASDIDRIMSGSNACPERYGLIGTATSTVGALPTDQNKRYDAQNYKRRSQIFGFCAFDLPLCRYPPQEQTHENANCRVDDPTVTHCPLATGEG